MLGSLSSVANTRASKTRLGSSAGLELINLDGRMWVGPILMGGTVNLDVVYDTGSDWVSIESVTCLECEGDKYDFMLSEGKP